MRTVLPTDKSRTYVEKEAYHAVGKPIPRMDAVDKVTGDGEFVADIKLSGMLYAKILRSPHPHAYISDIDTGAAKAVEGVRAVVTGEDLRDEMERTGVTLENILQNMKIMKEKELTLAGLLIFGRNPQQFRPYLKTWAIHFYGNDQGATEFIDRKELTGKLTDQLRRAEIFFRDHLRNPARIEGFDRIEGLEIPPEILREAVVNALAHRDYAIMSNIRIFIFDDRVEIISPGKLPNTVTIENIRYGIHAERNPVIISYLSKFGKMTQIGTGIPRMISLAKKATGREPDFEENEGQFKVIIHRSENKMQSPED